MSTKKIARYALAGGILGAALAVAMRFFKKMPWCAEAVKPFDIHKYMGMWYEIARFDYRFERNIKDATAHYTLNDDGTVQVLNTGYDYAKKKWKTAKGKARFRGATNEGKLEVSFFGPFYAGYNVIAVDPSYKYALVAGRNLDYLWLLSREKTMPLPVKENYLEKARHIGYDTGRLTWVQQD